MSRYIDAEWLKELYKPYESFEGKMYSVPVGAILANIDDAPSIDIVRCNECKWLRYCETEDFDLYLDCDKPDGGGIPRSEDWYCADGERREP